MKWLFIQSSLKPKLNLKNPKFRVPFLKQPLFGWVSIQLFQLYVPFFKNFAFFNEIVWKFRLHYEKQRIFDEKNRQNLEKNPKIFATNFFNRT